MEKRAGRKCLSEMAAKPWQDHTEGLGITTPKVFHKHSRESSTTSNLSLGNLNERWVVDLPNVT